MLTKNGSKFSKILLAAMLILLIFCTVFPSTAVAEESSLSKLAAYRDAYEQTDVTEDLEDVDLSSYRGSNSISAISLTEFGYNDKDLSGYGLYLYIYNDTGEALIDYKLNRIQLSVDGSTYNKYRLTILDKNADETVYKMKISSTSDNGYKIFEHISSDKRIYSISGMEIVSGAGFIDYPISQKYTYSGYAAFEEGDESTLECSVEKQDTVLITGLEDRQTVYRTDMDNPNMQSHNQINSVYFAVDNYFMHTYGKLQQIEAEWWEYRTSPIVVTNNEDCYNSLSMLSAKYSEENPIGYTRVDDEWGIGDWQSTQIGGYGPLRTYNWVYNIETYVSENGNGVRAFSRPNNLYWILRTSTWGADLENYVVSQEDLEELRFSFEQSQRAHFSEDDHGYSYCLELFNKEVGEGRTAGYNRKVFDSTDPNDMINFKEYDPNYRGWDAFKNIFGWEDDFDEVLTDVSPIVLIDSSNSEYYFSGSTEEISDKLLIAEEDVAKIKQYVSNAVKNDETVVLFRFANTEYYSNIAHAKDRDGEWVEDIAFTAEENVFLNFDIMTLGFYDGYEYTVIPVVSSPVDIISDIVGPALQDTLGDMIMYYILIAIAAIVAVLVLVLLYGILDMISNSVMSAPRRNTKNYNRRKRRR